MATPANTAVIAGGSAGVRVRANPATKPVMENLVKMAKKGNHWAAVVVREISSLTSGHFKNSVYVKQKQSGDKRVMFTMVLPGCEAKILKRANGEYLLYELNVDNSYHESQQSASKPALYRASKKLGAWSAELAQNGRVHNEKNRIVAITDQYEDPNDAARKVSHFVAEAPIGGGSYIDSDGFDMHFTPGEHKIGGMARIHQARNSESDESLHETALLLADTMKNAKNTKQVRWISERGGCGVLTQAMQILKEKRVSFADSNHLVFFSYPTTQLTKAESLAREIGMKFDRDTKKVDRLNLDQMVGGLGVCGGHIAAWNRFKSDPEQTALKLGADLFKETMDSKSAASTVAISVGAVTAALGVTAGGAGVGAVATLAAGIGSVAGLGVKLTKAWLRDHYNNVASKL